MRKLTPKHLIFGWKDHSKKWGMLSTKTTKHGDAVWSERNFNLYWVEDERLRLRQLVWMLRGLPGLVVWEGKEDPYEADVDMRENPMKEACEACQKRTNLPCALYQNPETSPPADMPYKELVKATVWPHAEPTARISRLAVCEIIQWLLGFTETAAEKRFYELYFDYALYTDTLLKEHDASAVLQQAYDHPEKVGKDAEVLIDYGRPEVGNEAWHEGVRLTLQTLWDSPALIPQANLNVVPTSELPDDHPDKGFLDSHEGRVDFMFFDGNGKHIVQIDGPYHHQSEERYTQVLRRDRGMRRASYHVHRFSNMEVFEARDFRPFVDELF